MKAVANTKLALLQGVKQGHFAPHMPVTPNSVLAADEWVYATEDLPRLKLYRRKLLTISWRGSEANAGCDLPPFVIEVLKSFAVLYQHEPASVVPRALKQTNHPRTVCSTLQVLLAFLGHVFESQGLPLEDDTFSLEDLRLSDVRNALRSWGGSGQDRLRIALVALTTQILRKIHPHTCPRWTASDVQQLSFKKPTPRDDEDKVLPGPLFRLLSNSATDTVCGFLRVLGAEVGCGEAGYVPPFLEQFCGKGAQVLDEYIELRRARAVERRTPGVAAVKANACATTLNKNFRRDYGFTADEFNSYLHQVHRAACGILALYTAGRYSDLTFFRVGCLKKYEGMWFLMGTHVKHQDINKPLGEDPWPAIPIMRDAVSALTALSKVSGNPFLLAALDLRGRGKAYSQSGMYRAFGTFLREADVNGTWSGVTLSSQRCRNTLAHQLARADLALPYISRHLKHMHTSLSGLPADVTLTYGGIAQLQVERAVQAQAIRKGMARSLYDLKTPVAGGGGKKFMRERKEYYAGRMEAGATEEEVREELVATGIPLSGIGTGFCAGRKELPGPNGTTRKPPCVGSLGCSPDDCDNSLITPIHAAVWRKAAAQNEALVKRPEFAYCREEQLTKLAKARKVLSDLRMQP